MTAGVCACRTASRGSRSSILAPLFFETAQQRFERVLPVPDERALGKFAQLAFDEVLRELVDAALVAGELLARGVGRGEAAAEEGALESTERVVVDALRPRHVALADVPVLGHVEIGSAKERALGGRARGALDREHEPLALDQHE